MSADNELLAGILRRFLHPDAPPEIYYGFSHGGWLTLDGTLEDLTPAEDAAVQRAIEAEETT